jgi:hypothetical protein
MVRNCHRLCGFTREFTALSFNEAAPRIDSFNWAKLAAPVFLRQPGRGGCGSKSSWDVPLAGESGNCPTIAQAKEIPGAAAKRKEAGHYSGLFTTTH